MKVFTVGRRMACAALGTSVAACLALAPAAHADGLFDSLPNCSAQPVSQPFAPFLDPLSYFKVPGGDFESGAPAWTLAGGAGPVAGNEPWHVGGAGDTGALALPAGSTATSPAVCVGADSPVMRVFARKTSDNLLGLSMLLVQSVSQDASGNVLTLPVGVVLGSSAWAPSAPLPLLASVASVLPGQASHVELTFTPVGPGNWQIDDAYVDPYHRCC